MTLESIKNDLISKGIKFKIVPFGLNAKILIDENGVIYKGF